ncbi:MAG: ABC transporter substrate-binding protein [Bryobacterales bacterium]|nr:ABC transporter substrate-binding protein [Bryobacterales bacterium]
MRGAILVCLLLLGSCARPDTKPRLRVAVLAGSLGHLPLYLAHSLGYFAEEGLDVHMEELSSTSKTMEAVLGGSVEIGASTYEQVLQMTAAGGSVKSFFVLALRPTQVLVVSPRRPDIRRIEDLRGKTVGITSLGSATQSVLSRLLLNHGMTLADVTAVGIGSSGSAVAAVEHGKVDAALLISLAFEQLRARSPGVTVLLDARTAEGCTELFGVPAVVGSGVVATPRWLTENGTTARKVTRALARAAKWIQDQSLADVHRRLPTALRSPESAADLHALRVMRPSLSQDGRMPPEGPARAAAFLRSVGHTNLPTDLSPTYTEEFLEIKP